MKRDDVAHWRKAKISTLAASCKVLWNFYFSLFGLKHRSFAFARILIQLDFTPRCPDDRDLRQATVSNQVQREIDAVLYIGKIELFQHCEIISHLFFTGQDIAMPRQNPLNIQIRHS